ncbi:ABC transporter ATP-binding protein [Streptosporangium sp. KLBMP 9127]|nr:ABC transporter ATP-binding protein/permease [Streptosporangium sp. KLBMP 9127]
MRAADRLVIEAVRRGGPWPSVLAVAAGAGTAGELALPITAGMAIDAMVTGAPDRTAWLIACAAIVVGVMVCETVAVWARGVSGAQASARMRRRILRHVLGVGPSIKGRFAEGDLVTRAGMNAEEVGRAPEALISGLTLLVPTVGGLVALTLIDPVLTLTLAVGIAVILLILRAFLRASTTVAGDYQNVQGEIAGRLLDALEGARTIAATGTAEQEARRVLRPLPRLRAHGLELWRVTATAGVRAGIMVPVLEVAVIAVGGLRLAAGELTVGQLYAAARYAVLGAALSTALGYVGRLARARSAAARVADLLAVPATGYGTRVLPPGSGRVEFEEVAVPGLEVRGLVLAGGSATAVVGRSGAGKSLLAAVAGRLVDPARGTVRLDGVPLPELAQGELRRAVGFAFERPVLVGDTVGEAIGMGAADPGSVHAAATAACADGFIRRLPDGYDTPPDDAPMSVGERQRIGLARAFAQAERLLVLDDATSSLDTVTERQVARTLTGASDGRTRLIVAHRPATAARADQVVWLDAGRVRAQGPHRVLWEDPDYRAVFQAAAP